MIENRKIAVFPGSFDPFTKGHEDIVRRALPLFDALYIAIGHNISKKRTFDISSHIEGIQRLFANETKVKVISYEGLTIDFCHQVKAKYIIR
ncbi:MAG: adenylyltransferase/cytidyltransferase family protein, partial [Bacteroidales bacterium]|nr:adenylyltransferase/cytidyltransferase family protein [Bacteroidales bacterium]